MSLPVGKMFLSFFNQNLFPPAEARGKIVSLHAMRILFNRYIEVLNFAGISFSNSTKVCQIYYLWNYIDFLVCKIKCPRIFSFN